ncbi:MAG: polysaccharide biosynthesis C-terminal domain-containing protein, partial [Blautia sp.]|nr:polysaccharide biosynthesis C-terminal domain-containing protein [Blautia sp.]
LTLASTAPTSMIPEVSAHYAEDNIPLAISKIDRATWISMFISIPAAIGLAAVSGPVIALLFPKTNGVGGNLLALGAITVILNGNSNISNGVLQGIGKPKLPMIHAAIALVVDIIAMALLLLFTDLGIYTIVIAMIIYAVVMCLLNDRSMKKYLGYETPWRMAYINPLLASIPMAAVAAGAYYGAYALLHSNFICLMIAVPLAMVVYLLVYLLVSKPSVEDLGMIPGGRYLVKIVNIFGGKGIE